MPGAAATKVIVAGPAKSGKTMIANFLSGHTPELTPGTYLPTAAVRVLEFDAKLTGNAARAWGGPSLALELWDCSGDTKYENCWPAIQKDANGVLLVYNPESPAQVIEVENWYEWFVKNMGLTGQQCVLCAFRGPGRGIVDNQVPHSLRGVEFLMADIDGPEDISRAFMDLLGNLAEHQ